MTLRTALITYVIGVLLVEAVLLGGLALLGADSESIAAAYVLLLSGASLGGGYIFTRFH